MGINQLPCRRSRGWWYRYYGTSTPTATTEDYVDGAGADDVAWRIGALDLLLSQLSAMSEGNRVQIEGRITEIFLDPSQNNRSRALREAATNTDLGGIDPT